MSSQLRFTIGVSRVRLLLFNTARSIAQLEYCNSELPAVELVDEITPSP